MMIVGTSAARAIVAHLPMLLQLRMSPTFNYYHQINGQLWEGSHCFNLGQNHPTCDAEIVVGHQSKEDRKEEEIDGNP